MKLKSILGTFVALGAMALMAIGVQAATYTAGTVSGTAGDEVVVPVQVDVDTDASETININAFTMVFTYNPTLATPKVMGTDDLGEDCYAVAGSLFAEVDNSVFVSSIVEVDSTTSQLIVAWAGGSYVTVSYDDVATAVLAEVTFTVADTAAEDIPVTLVAATVATDDGNGNVTQADVDSAELVSGTINLASAFLYGDVDKNSVVDANDATLILQNVAGTYTFTDELVKIGDVDNNTAIDSNDATLILQKVAGTLTTFPVEE